MTTIYASIALRQNSPSNTSSGSYQNSIPLRDSRLPKHTADTAEGVIPYRAAASTVVQSRGMVVFFVAHGLHSFNR